MNPPDFFHSLISADDREQLEEELRHAVEVSDAFLGEVATHLISAGGKRLRPALTLAAASLGGRSPDLTAMRGGVSVELIHLASLYHDDVMDEATRRRSVVSVNARWGNLVAIVAGDFLLARSAEIAAALGTEIATLIAATLGRLCQGQVAELRAAFRVDRTEADYLSAIADKTAALMSTACRVGGIAAGLAPAHVEALTVYGEALGMVFQIRDDVLDVVSSEEELGKSPGQDLAEGIYTLPVQRAVEDDDIGPMLRPLLGQPLDRETLDTARHLVAASPGVAAAALVARSYAIEALEATRRLDEGPVSAAFADLVHSLLTDLDRSTEALAS